MSHSLSNTTVQSTLWYAIGGLSIKLSLGHGVKHAVAIHQLMHDLYRCTTDLTIKISYLKQTRILHRLPQAWGVHGQGATMPARLHRGGPGAANGVASAGDSVRRASTSAMAAGVRLRVYMIVGTMESQICMDGHWWY